MGNVIRVTIPNPSGGYYNALTDPNLDHYSLYTDQDNILIKELVRAKVNFKYSDYPDGYEITHNLGYVPKFLAFVKDPNNYIFSGSKDCWARIGNANLSIAYGAFATTTKIVLYDGTNVATDYIYFIFYDKEVGSNAQSIAESDRVLKIAKAGINALTSIDPNDYIVHSDLNTFKIVKEGLATINYTGSGVYSFNHQAPITNPSVFETFVKFPDGSITMGNGTFIAQSRDGNWSFAAVINTTQIKCNIYGPGGTGTFYVSYKVYEAPLV